MTKRRRALTMRPQKNALRTWAVCITLLLLLVTGTPLFAEPPARGLKICVSSNAPVPVHQAAEAVLAAAKTHPLLAVFCGSRAAPTGLTDTSLLLADKPEARAYDHLVLIGLSDDPLIRAAWQREARAEDGGFYVFGFGHLAGDIGYVESDRNPFLHGRAIPQAPYETQIVTITGSTPAGVALAVDAFLKRGLVNGTVAAVGWKRPRPSLLDRDPLAPGFHPPEWLPAQSGEARQIGFSQPGEDEYRGVLEDAGTKPVEMWRVKYYVPGAWDGAGAAQAFDDYAAGLHRRAYGNTVWCARFSSPAQAGAAATKIASAAKLKPSSQGWAGAQPPYGPQKESPGPLTLWQHRDWLLMSTLSAANTKKLRDSAH